MAHNPVKRLWAGASRVVFNNYAYTELQTSVPNYWSDVRPTQLQDYPIAAGEGGGVFHPVVCEQW